MGMWIGRNRKARVTYGFDEIALVPGSVTLNPNEVNTTFRLPRRDPGFGAADADWIVSGGLLLAVLVGVWWFYSSGGLHGSIRPL